MKFYKKINVLIASIMTISVFALTATPAQAALFDSAKGDACQGATLGGSRNCTDKADDNLQKTIEAFINLFSVVIGIVAVVMIMVAGFRYITSAGDTNGITSAKHTLIYAVVGLIIVALAQVIVKFVLNKV